ncbi:MAG: RHS domain-containing protein [Deltaproteobacteria bacterium]|nr:RHS domain-containing protein [Deltaproteobacteria bacterium]
MEPCFGSIYLDGEPIALREYQTNPGTYYFINDHLGTPRQLVTATGTIAWQAAYLPFGKAQIQTETVKNNLRFPGQYFDDETGLHYNWNRFYDPETGRYVTADPIGLDGGMNLYGYVDSNPVNLIDPSGQNAIACTLVPVIIGAQIIWTAICNNPPKPIPIPQPTPKPDECDGRWTCETSVYANVKGGGPRERVSLGKAIGHGSSRYAAYEDMCDKAEALIQASGYAGIGHGRSFKDARCWRN